MFSPYFGGRPQFDLSGFENYEHDVIKRVRRKCPDTSTIFVNVCCVAAVRITDKQRLPNDHSNAENHQSISKYLIELVTNRSSFLQVVVQQREILHLTLKRLLNL